MLADLARKVGHVSFLGPLNHTQMRALAFRHSQLSGFERVSQTLERVCSRSRLELPMHVSTRPLRSVPGYAFPFTEQTEHIQKRARLQSVDCGYMLTLDTGDCAAFSSIFLRLSIFPIGWLRAVRPSASNANRWARCIKNAHSKGRFLLLKRYFNFKRDETY